MILKCCFTGHRPQCFHFGFNEYNWDCIKLKNAIKKNISDLIDEGYNHFITGMALGVDMWAAEAVIGFAKKNREIILEAAIPCENQPEKYNIRDKKRYKEILSKCHKITYISKEYTPDCMQIRNMYMVDNSDCVLAVFNGTKSGTYKTLEYAKSVGKKIVLIDASTAEKQLCFFYV